MTIGILLGMRTSTAVQLSEPLEIAKTRFALADPANDRQSDEEPLGPVKSISVDVLVEDHVWLDNYAEYLNELKRQEIEALNLGKGVKKPKGTRKTRKSLSEEWLRAALKAKKAELKALTDQLGPFPPADDEVAVRRYVKRAIALGSKK